MEQRIYRLCWIKTHRLYSHFTEGVLGRVTLQIPSREEDAELPGFGH